MKCFILLSFFAPLEQRGCQGLDWPQKKGEGGLLSLFGEVCNYLPEQFLEIRVNSTEKW